MNTQLFDGLYVQYMPILYIMIDHRPWGKKVYIKGLYTRFQRHHSKKNEIKHHH